MLPQAGFVYRTQERRAAGWPCGPVEIRPAGGADAEAIRSFITGLSQRTQYRRFFAGVSPPGSALLRGLCGAGNGADILVAARGGLIVGHAMAADGAAADGMRTVDVGLVVADGSQRRGIGSALMRALLARAIGRGASVIVMDVQPGNSVVLAMIARHWPSARYESTADSVAVRACLAVPARVLAPSPVPAEGRSR